MDMMTNTAEEMDAKLLLAALTALKKGDFSVRMPTDWTGVAGKIADERKAYLARGQLEKVLTPLPGSTGTSMIVVPADNPVNPSKVYAFELAQLIQGRDGTTTGDGVLIYSVDASVPTGKSPVNIVPAKRSTSPVYGELFEAPFSAGSTFDDPALPFSLSVKAKSTDGYVVALKVR